MDTSRGRAAAPRFLFVQGSWLNAWNVLIKGISAQTVWPQSTGMKTQWVYRSISRDLKYNPHWFDCILNLFDSFLINWTISCFYRQPVLQLWKSKPTFKTTVHDTLLFLIWKLFDCSGTQKGHLNQQMFWASLPTSGFGSCGPEPSGTSGTRSSVLFMQLCALSDLYSACLCRKTCG